MEKLQSKLQTILISTFINVAHIPNISNKGSASQPDALNDDATQEQERSMNTSPEF